MLIASSSFPTPGGAELRFQRYLPLLRDNGIEVEVIAGTPKRKKFSREDHDAKWRSAKDGELVSMEEIEGAKVFKYKLPETGAKKRSQFLLNQAIVRCEDQEAKPDVIQILFRLPDNSIRQLTRIKAASIPIVFSYAIAHTLSSNALLRSYQYWRIRRIYKYFNCIIAASEVLKELVAKIVPDMRIEVVPNGIDADQFCPVKDHNEKAFLRNQLGLPENAKIITLVGSIHPRKGSDLLVQAWSDLVKSHSELHLVLIGPRYDQTRKELNEFRLTIENAIEGSENTGNVHFLGNINNVGDYLKASDIFVFPSQKEGMPNAVLEAMATGLPLILTPFIGLSDDFGAPGQEYLLVNRSSSEIASAMQSLLNDDQLRKLLGKNARNWVEKTMDIKSSVRLHADLYHSLARRSMPIEQ